ncbi:MAG: hypothetical protein QM775_32915 [Pirellulales bacterium]
MSLQIKADFPLKITEQSFVKKTLGFQQIFIVTPASPGAGFRFELIWWCGQMLAVVLIVTTTVICLSFAEQDSSESSAN